MLRDLIGGAFEGAFAAAVTMIAVWAVVIAAGGVLVGLILLLS